MHVSIIYLQLLATTILATPLTIKRGVLDVRSIKGAIEQVDGATKNLDIAISGVKDANSLAPVTTMSDALSTALKTAVQTIGKADKVDVLGAQSIGQSATGLTATLKQLTADLIVKKPIIDKAGASSVVQQMLIQQKAQAGALSAAITAKVPLIAQPIAENQAKTVNDTLDQAILAFNPSAGASTTPAAPAKPPKSN